MRIYLGKSPKIREPSEEPLDIALRINQEANAIVGNDVRDVPESWGPNGIDRETVDQRIGERFREANPGRQGALWSSMSGLLFL